MTPLELDQDHRAIPFGDFVAKGLSVVMPDSCFPNMTTGDESSQTGLNLRSEFVHNRYSDRQAPQVAFLNRDEAVLLYNLALQFRDKPGLEIGCWKGWSTCHLALAGAELDVIDPILSDPEHLKSVRDSLGAAGILARVRLYAASSPHGVRHLAKLTSTKWNFFFINGDHEGKAPAFDAAECLEHAATDAMIVFHSLIEPEVEQGLNLLWRKGWNVLVYHTRQMMGIAWRGAVKPVTHEGDPRISWTIPPHLLKYPVSGESPEEEAHRMSQCASLLLEENSRLLEESTYLRASLERVQSEVAARDRELEALRMAQSAREDDSSAETVQVAPFGKRARERLRVLHSDGPDSAPHNAPLYSSGMEPAPHTGGIVEHDGHIQRLFLAVERFIDEIGRLSSAPGGVLPDFQSIIGSNLWRAIQPMRRIRASRFAPRINLLLLGLAYRILKSVRRQSSIDKSMAVDVKRSRVALFDVAFYCEMNPDVGRSGLDPFEHYIRLGAAEGRDPHPLFDTSFYYEKNPHLKQPGINPLLHYLNQGALEGKDPHPLFDTAFYFERNPDVKKQGINPLVHFVAQGAAEGRDPHPLFDSTFYNEQNPDVAKSGVNPLLHYLTVGATEGRDPHPLFDSSFHIENNPDVAKAGINPLSHYVVYGAKEDRDPHPLFDTSFYREQKPEVRDLAINPLVHFLNEGPTPEFDPLTPSPDLPDTGICIVTPDIIGPVRNGGIGTACYHFARVLAKAGHAVSVLFSGDLTDCQKAHWQNFYARYKIKFIALSDTPIVGKLVYGSAWFYERSWRIFEHLRTSHYSVIHFQDWQANGFWSIKAKRTGLEFQATTLTLMTHSSTKWINDGMEQFGSNPLETAKLVWAETYCMENCDTLLSPSRYMIEWVRKESIRLPERTILTPYVWSDDCETGKRTSSLVDNDHLIFFGRLETRKGLHIFCDAIRQLKVEGTLLPRKISFLGKCAMVRGKPAAEYLQDFRREFSTIEICIINNFDYLQALRYIRTSNGLVVICSIVDNYPLTVIESIQNRLPFLAAATGGIPEMVSELVSFEPTVSALANCLRKRAAFDHEGVRHKYSPNLAEKIWSELNAELTSCSTGPSEESGNSIIGMRRVPSVSICIPYFNHFQFLETLVMSIARQTYPAFEVILVNDGSGPEGSAEFDRIKGNNRDARFKFLSTENHGPGAARNCAAASSTGDFLLFFDSDNLPKDTGFVSKLVRAIQRSGADCVTVPYDIVGPEKVLISERDVVATYRPTGSCLEAGFFENVFGDSTMIITRAAFESVGGFPTWRAAWEDHEFLLHLCFSGFKLETFPDSLFYYRKNPSGRNQQVNLFQNYQSLFDRLQQATSNDLARIIAAVGGPMLLARMEGPARELSAQ
jgi:GT2 family glycosyltransferase/glycosyltransferase involved in cell wall biosynthesis/predicted O-methyltransferase YrrM